MKNLIRDNEINVRIRWDPRGQISEIERSEHIYEHKTPDMIFPLQAEKFMPKMKTQDNLIVFENLVPVAKTIRQEMSIKVTNITETSELGDDNMDLSEIYNLI